VHASPVLQPAVTTPVPSCTQPVGETHVSVVHTLPSSQLTVPVPTHAPFVHVSVMVQASPSLHVVPSDACG
jgi:hypothetical protein